MDPQPLVRTRRALEVLPNPHTAYFWIVGCRLDGQPVFRGRWDTDYLCGACGAALCEGVKDGMMAQLWFECSCGALNRVPGGRHEAAAEAPE
jgi:hypothetical protein